MWSRSREMWTFERPPPRRGVELGPSVCEPRQMSRRWRLVVGSVSSCDRRGTRGDGVGSSSLSVVQLVRHRRDSPNAAEA